MRSANNAALQSLLVFILILAATWAVYYSGLQGSFLFDDHPNIVDNKKLHIDQLDWPHLKQAILSLDAGPLKRPVATFTLALNHYWSELNPYWYKATNLIIHLCNGLAVLWLSQLLLRAFNTRYRKFSERDLSWLAVTVSAAWVLHPINLTSVLYIVQRMTSLAALFSFLCMAFYAWGRLRQIDKSKGGLIILVGLLVFMPLAIFAKENALLLPFFLFLIEVSFFSFSAPARSTRRVVAYSHIILVCLPALAIIVFLTSHIDWLRSMYILRPFSLEERLLTESRVIWFYIQQIVFPVASKFGIYHDDIVLSSSIVSPVTTLTSIAGIAVLAILSVYSYVKFRWLFFGIAFFFIGHSIESSVFSLEIAHEHRNYLPSYGILFSFLFGITMLLGGTRLRKYRYVFGVLLVAAFAGITTIRAQTWSNSFTHAYVETRNHPNSARAHLELGRQYQILLISEGGTNAEYYNNAKLHYRTAHQLDPNNLTGLFSLVYLNSTTGREVDKSWIEEIHFRLRSLPIDLPTPALLVNLARCQENGACRLSQPILDRFFDAILSNKTLVGPTRSKTLAQAVQMAYTKGNLNEALSYAKAAVKNAPNEPQHLLNLLSIQLAMGQYEDAGITYNLLSSMKLSPYYSDKLLHYRYPFEG